MNETNLQDVQAYWDKHPAGFDEVKHLQSDRTAFFDERDRQTRGLYPNLDEQYRFAEAGGKTTLEVGCGMGFNAQRLAQCGAVLTAVDLAPHAVQLTQERFRLRGLRANWVVADAEHLPFAPAAFEMVFSSGVIHHSPDTQAAAREIERVLAVGGEARVMIYHRDSVWFWWDIILKLGALMVCLNLLPGAIRRRVMAAKPTWANYLLPAGERLKVADIIRAGTDFGGLQNPLSRVYTQRTARQLFAGLSSIKFVVNDAAYRPFAAPTGYVQLRRKAKNWINSRWGFFLTLYGTK